MPKTVYELKSKEELGEKINIYYDELLKADLQLMEEDVVNSIIKKQNILTMIMIIQRCKLQKKMMEIE